MEGKKRRKKRRRRKKVTSRSTEELVLKNFFSSHSGTVTVVKAILLNATALILLVKVDFGKKTLWLNDKVFLMRPATSAMTKISVGWHISLMISHGKT